MKNNTNGKLKVCVPDDIDKIKRTIKALKRKMVLKVKLVHTMY